MTVFELLSPLEGRWVGRGRGQYPTIEPFEFTEETTFLFAPEYPMVRYEQRTWLEPGREASHWELGVWRPVDGGELEISNAQDSGRVEVLRGSLAVGGGDVLTLTLVSKCFGNDPRLVRTERIITVRPGELHYVAFMATTTTAVPERLLHLEATLEKVADAPQRPAADGAARRR
ncbi:MAG: FABP family protein [Planctomycetes bacterium]|nr:FABP family protein [Planctomycetota bacterium]